MKTERIAISLTLINLGLIVYLLAQIAPADAGQVAPPILRGRALEIVDTNGRVRASITVEKPVTVDSKSYPETVLLRLTDPKNGPVVKLQATENGSALGMSDDADGGVYISAQDAGSFVKVTDKRGREQVLKP
jgi:hypothetical protein